jgi:hypothetical protein
VKQHLQDGVLVWAHGEHTYGIVVGSAVDPGREHRLCLVRLFDRSAINGLDRPKWFPESALREVPNLRAGERALHISPIGREDEVIVESVNPDNMSYLVRYIHSGIRCAHFACDLRVIKNQVCVQDTGGVHQRRLVELPDMPPTIVPPIPQAPSIDETVALALAKEPKFKLRDKVQYIGEYAPPRGITEWVVNGVTLHTHSAKYREPWYSIIAPQHMADDTKATIWSAPESALVLKPDQRRNAVPAKRSWCEQAIEIVRGNREGTYGKPTRNFETIAKMWNAYLSARPDLHYVDGRFNLSIVAVAHLMILVKLARLGNDRFHEDSHIDTAGYTDCAQQCVEDMQRSAQPTKENKS